ncbi:zf-TFIIB domain-containing protein [Nocardioidaceae bacterium SCSIO 66511]|nr:zf-TFIIB domain-containing protein [Nocardioidaceae bacterium SCSIO 66511]
MASMMCPKCQGQLSEFHRAGATISQCDNCEGIFLDRADLGLLIEEENAWHEANSGYHTQPLPKITPTMTAPPKSSKAKSRAFIDTLFGA